MYRSSEKETVDCIIYICPHTHCICSAHTQKKYVRSD